MASPFGFGEGDFCFTECRYRVAALRGVIVCYRRGGCVARFAHSSTLLKRGRGGYVALYVLLIFVRVFVKGRFGSIHVGGLAICVLVAYT